MKAFASLSALALTMLSMPAHADVDVHCKGGPQANWTPLSALSKKAWQEGWTVVKAQVEGDCYELYARTDTGQAVEAFYHPVTLQKLIVFRRGKEVFRAKGFTPQ